MEGFLKFFTYLIALQSISIARKTRLIQQLPFESIFLAFYIKTISFREIRYIKIAKTLCFQRFYNSNIFASVLSNFARKFDEKGTRRNEQIIRNKPFSQI